MFDEEHAKLIEWMGEPLLEMSRETMIAFICDLDWLVGKLRDGEAVGVRAGTH